MSISVQRSQFNHSYPILTRPHDNDLHGHVSGATVHGYFEAALQALLLQEAGLDLRDGEVTGFVVSSAADFFALPSFPDALEVTVAVTRLAGSTVEYRLGLFRPGEAEACALGRVVQVFVERASGRPVAVPDALQKVLAGLQLGEAVGEG
ncbi:acyl-CoA thioesterase [Pseudomonas cremoricolorata]|uniref:Thioesterase n=1 Tax=Pseudomonas cremoricolorata TaxID=157783 RepID=A0A089WPH0_9PSED|nr:thioesterase family protein [Pseudomonas cremoricolorata]AIR89049.1 thioesterase [Pseudomonas cremoricolorata]